MVSDSIVKQSDKEVEGSSKPHILSREETREILTPFAFEVDKTLFGLTLAAPYKRAFAILIDLIAIAILSSAPGELLAIVLAITFYKLGSKSSMNAAGKTRGTRRKRFARFIGAFILFILLIDMLPKVVNHFSPEDTDDSYLKDSGIVTTGKTDLAATLILAATSKSVIDVVSKSDCHILECWQVELVDAINFDALSKISIESKFAKEAFSSIAEETNLNKADQNVLVDFLMIKLHDSSPSGSVEKLTSDRLASDILSADSDSIHDLSTINASELNNSNENELEPNTEKQSKPVYSIIKYIKGIIDDLGLGFGWAAFYFTVLTSVWQGQTIGKKLFSIKVLQLDGTRLSLWDSFGRYGGYGAGLATGLLGFIQIYWDANRQAIHDQISATVVVDAKQSGLKTNDK